jgi:hypothetical protein
VFARSSLLWLVPLVPCVAFAAFGACSPQQGAPSGTQCFTADDCATGLACVPKGSSRICSSNLTGLETEIDGGADAGESGDAGPIMLADGSLRADGTTAAPDSSTPVDTGPPPPVDAGHDSTMPPVDAGHPQDTGTPPVDAGHDAGSPPADAASATG